VAPGCSRAFCLLRFQATLGRASEAASEGNERRDALLGVPLFTPYVRCIASERGADAVSEPGDCPLAVTFIGVRLFNMPTVVQLDYGRRYTVEPDSRSCKRPEYSSVLLHRRETHGVRSELQHELHNKIH
jgi:hypothetical protein